MGEHLFERLARERNITVKEMRAIISARIEKGWNDPDPEKQEQWRKYLVREIFLHRMNGCGMRLRNCRRKVGRICCAGILIYKYCGFPV